MRLGASCPAGSQIATPIMSEGSNGSIGVRVHRALCNEPHRLICRHICPSVPEQEFASRVLCGRARMLSYRACQEATTVRYAEFRYRFEDALQQVGLFIHDVDRVETIDLADTSRRWKVHIIRPAPRGASLLQTRWGRFPEGCGDLWIPDGPRAQSLGRSPASRGGGER